MKNQRDEEESMKLTFKEFLVITFIALLITNIIYLTGFAGLDFWL